ncbi:DUF1501 domain-containing protein [Planctomicrobium sp. SH668]|uniref:DUF1501 domain-containing protein n=1 Tax=Planctomicrobium sp. SH668 TaxID=3448126 RepID=UPI003F5B4FA6
MNPELPFAYNRRAFLNRSSVGLGTLALAQLLQNDARAAMSKSAGRGPHVPHHEPSADSVICLFQHGGPSQMDLFDPKPELSRRHGQPYEGDLEIHFVGQKGNILGSPFQFAPRGESGIELSELLPHTSTIVDEMTLVRSVTTDSVDHESALRLIHSGKFQAGYPTWGAWVSYGLGTVNQNLPAYVVLTDPGGMPVDNVRNWTAGWLPAEYQGTAFRPGKFPVPNLQPPADVTVGGQAGQLKFLEELNRSHLERHPENNELMARIQDFEIAARMQTTVPELLDISDETEATQKMYGLDNPVTAEYGTRCLIARRLVERGVRFVQLFLAGQPWDTHSKNAEELKKNCARTDQPSAALVQDLKQRGLLDRTIVLWGGEFGRLPISQGTDGRDHNRHANSLWLAGGGFQQGYAHGQTDDFGYKAVHDVVSVHDLHATLLHALGLQHHRLTYPNDGRLSSLTDVEITKARVIPELLRSV